MEEKVAVFIDGANLFHGLQKDFGNIKIDFERLVYKLLDGRSLVRTYYYTALPDQKIDPERYKTQQTFLNALERKPYFSVKLGRLERRGSNYVEKGVDIALAVEMLQMGYRDTYNTAILISGDGDFSIVVEAIKALGKHVENAATRSCLSRNLQQTCDRIITLDNDFLSDCWR